jgi:hypothetical protein
VELYDKWGKFIPEKERSYFSKSISIYICNKVLLEVYTDHPYWIEVRKILENYNHDELYNFKK